jgi:sensor domain CHASE-containing protein
MNILATIHDRYFTESVELTVLAIIIVVLLGALYLVWHERNKLRDQQTKLREQQLLNTKLEKTVDRVLKIDAEGGVDSNRTKPKQD